MEGPVENAQASAPGVLRNMSRSTRARLLAALAVITPAGLVLVNVAAYVMENLGGFRVGITISAFVSTIVLNAITGVAAYRAVATRLSDNRWIGWMFQPKYLRSNAVAGGFLLILIATITGRLTYLGLSDPKDLPNLQTFLAGLLGLIVPILLAALFRDEVTPRMRRRYRTRR